MSVHRVRNTRAGAEFEEIFLSRDGESMVFLASQNRVTIEVGNRIRWKKIQGEDEVSSRKEERSAKGRVRAIFS